MTDNLFFGGIVDSFRLQGKPGGPLSGKTFVVKDLFDVAERVTGAGIPDWKATHEPAAETAVAVQALLAAGADLIGKSLTDELAFSVDGINIHYGVPVNPNLPGHIPGGSSSGSASAVASQLCDFALGTDTLGSVRIPSSYCGVYGIRPTHGRVSTVGAIPLGQSFDTAGWFSRDPEVLSEVGKILLAQNNMYFGVPGKPGLESFTFRFAPELVNFMEDTVREEFVSAATELMVRSDLDVDSLAVEFPEGAIEHFFQVMDVIRGWEAWNNHGAWMLEARPDMSEAIMERFLQCRKITEPEMKEALHEREEIVRFLTDLLKDTVVCAPVTWRWPPAVDAPADELAANRKKNVRLNVMGSIGGLPQIVIPVRIVEGGPCFGVSFIAGAGCDELLLSLAIRVHAARKV